MKLSIQGQSIDKSKMPYVHQLKSLLEAGPVEQNGKISFFGHSKADLFILFSMPSITMGSTDNLSDDRDCDCDYCMDYMNETEHWKCQYEEAIFESADIEEWKRVPSTGQSFSDIINTTNEEDLMNIDFVVGMKSELSDNVASLRIPECLVEVDNMEENPFVSALLLKD